MSKLHQSAFLLTLVATVSSAPSSHTRSRKGRSSHEHYNNPCGVYLAPSTIPGAGLGMYAGQNYSTNDMVTAGDIMIPIVELGWHNGFKRGFFLWDEYTWSHSISSDMEVETEGDDLYAASTGIGAAINCMLSLVNVVDSYAKCDNAGLHRSTDPGSGAFTPYHDRKSVATQEIVAGDELFIDYGDEYFRSREETYGLIPLSDDFPMADEILKKYQTMRDSALQNISDHLEDDLWSLITKFPIESRVLNALPPSKDQVDELVEIGSALQHKARSQRTLEWLNQHGQCIDNIKPGMSGIPQAGRGVFASRNMTKGTLVAPAPLIHIPDRSVLTMYSMLPMDNEGYITRNVSSPNHVQLMVNYCFGHPQSSLLLCPYGSLTSLINHSPTPNTRIVWSTTMRHPEWRDKEPMTLKREWHSGLSFDFVALKNINKEEEITIDYGSEWDHAWGHHVNNWTPPKGAETYEAAFELNHQVSLKIRIMSEQPYSETLLLWIRGEYTKHRGIDFFRVLVLNRFVDYNGKHVYTALPYSTKETAYVTIIKYHASGALFGIPRDAFVFDDVPYTRDHQMTWSFRHDMKIPDDMMPEAWKNNVDEV